MPILKNSLSLNLPLISFNSSNFPLNLDLQYNQIHDIPNVDILNQKTGFPHGFKTNFHLFLRKNSDSTFIYEDKNGFYHHFNLAINSQNLYYDTFGSGLMLLETDDGYRVFDDFGNYQIFDIHGRLINITRKVSSNLDSSFFVTYLDDSSLKIYTISDSFGRTLNFL